MKNNYSTLSWKCKYYDCNANRISDYDVLTSMVKEVKQLRKKCDTIESFSECLKLTLLSIFSSRCEYELIVKRESNRIWLIPWAGCRDTERVKIDVTDDKMFDWNGFANKHIRHDNCQKIDIYDQILYKWENFVDYCWYTRLKYERDNPKFHR